MSSASLSHARRRLLLTTFTSLSTSTFTTTSPSTVTAPSTTTIYRCSPCTATTSAAHSTVSNTYSPPLRDQPRKQLHRRLWTSSSNQCTAPTHRHRPPNRRIQPNHRTASTCRTVPNPQSSSTTTSIANISSFSSSTCISSASSRITSSFLPSPSSKTTSIAYRFIPDYPCSTSSRSTSNYPYSTSSSSGHDKINTTTTKGTLENAQSCSSTSEPKAKPAINNNPEPSQTAETQTNTNSDTNESEKPYYVTTPIFYVNAAPHVGHLYSMVLADILKRWQQLRGLPNASAILCTGTDEHGMKVQQASAKAGSHSPKAFCDLGAETFQNLAKAANISNDHFVRTTDPDHKEAVLYAWTVLQEHGYIYLDKHEGWYSVSDETFYPQAQVQLIVEPATGRKIMSSIETGKEVEWTSEVNYKFRLSAMKSRLLDFYNSHPDFIVPKTRMREVVAAVSEGLEDLSVSRPASRLSWGIPVPTDDTQTIYVWLDALVNYITKAGYPWQPGAEQRLGWPADVQIIGKDIMRFHCIYWPAFLLALGLPPPKQILTHAHWTLGRAKMAKSTGNVVNPLFALDRFGVDVLRFYLAHDGGITDDADYNNEQIIERYRTSLMGVLGNLASRIMRGKGWSVRRAVQRFTGSAGPNLRYVTDDTVASAAKVQLLRLRDVANNFERDMKELKISDAIKRVLFLLSATNKFLQTAEPWRLVERQQAAAAAAAADSPGNVYSLETLTMAEVDQIIFSAVEALRICGILLQPVMPSKMSMLLDMLGVHEDARSLAYAHLAADAAYGEPKVPLHAGYRGVLFPPLAANS